MRGKKRRNRNSSGHKQEEIIGKELDVKPIDQAQKGFTAVRGCRGQQRRIEAWGASAWVPCNETEVEIRGGGSGGFGGFGSVVWVEFQIVGF